MKTIIVNKTKFKIIKKEVNRKSLFKQNRFHNEIKEYATCHCKYCGKKFGMKKRDKFLGNKRVFMKNRNNFKENVNKNYYVKKQLKFLLSKLSLDELILIKKELKENFCTSIINISDNIYGVDTFKNAIEVKKYEFECCMKELGDCFKKEVNNKKVRI